MSTKKGKMEDEKDLKNTPKQKTGYLNVSSNNNNNDLLQKSEGQKTILSPTLRYEESSKSLENELDTSQSIILDLAQSVQKGIERMTDISEHLSRIAPPIGKVPTFAGTDSENIESWLDEFELVAMVNKWEGIVLALRLRESLRGAASTWVESQSLSVKHDYTAIKNVLRKGFSAEAHKFLVVKQLKERKHLPTESIYEYAAALNHMIEYINPKMEDKDKMNTFILGLNSDEQAFVIERLPKTYSEALELATKFEF